MSIEIIEAVASAKAELTEGLGHLYGSGMAPAEAVVALRGDFQLSLAYAALFFPLLSFEGAVPFARFATGAKAVPLDCFHVDLLHHSEAPGRTPALYSALGTALAAAWSLALERQGLSGRFVYEGKEGSDVVYRP